MTGSSKKSEDKNSLVEGPILPIIFRLGMPTAFGIVAIFSISIVDTYFVGQLGTDQLAALSFTFPVTMAVASLSVGLGAGASSVVSRAIGAGDKTHAKRLSTDSLLLAGVLVMFISAVGYFTITPLFTLLGASGDVLTYITQYMRIWYISMPFLVIPIVANAIIRSVGNALWPSFIMFFFRSNQYCIDTGHGIWFWSNTRNEYRRRGNKHHDNAHGHLNFGTIRCLLS